MKTNKKISIKIKSKTERRIMEEPQVEIITEWNVKRIFIALLVILLLVIIPAYYLSSLNEEPVLKDIKQSDIETETVTLIPEITMPPIKSDIAAVIKPLKDEVIEPQETYLQKEAIVPQAIKQITKSSVKNSFEQLHPNISRARLAKSMQGKEPYEDVELPFLVNSEQAKGLFYFTEINNMKGNTVFHEWLKNGKSIYKRKIKIRGNRWRISTSKLFNNNHVGEWQVRTLDQQGKVLNEITFLVTMP